MCVGGCGWGEGGGGGIVGALSTNKLNKCIHKQLQRMFEDADLFIAYKARADLFYKLLSSSRMESYQTAGALHSPPVEQLQLQLQGSLGTTSPTQFQIRVFHLGLDLAGDTSDLTRKALSQQFKQRISYLNMSGPHSPKRSSLDPRIEPEEQKRYLAPTCPFGVVLLPSSYRAAFRSAPN